MSLGLQMEKIRVDNQMAIFYTGPYGDPPLKIKILKIWLRSDPKLGLKPKFHDPGTLGGFGKQITHKQTDKIHVL